MASNQGDPHTSVVLILTANIHFLNWWNLFYESFSECAHRQPALQRVAML